MTVARASQGAYWITLATCCTLAYCPNAEGQADSLLFKDPDRIAEVGSDVQYRVFPKRYQPAITSTDQRKEEEAGRYLMRPTGDAGVIRFAASDALDIGCHDLDKEILALAWIGTFDPGEIHTLSIVPNRIAPPTLAIVRHLQVARLHVGFRNIEEVRALRQISKRLEEIYLYEVPNGLFEFRKDLKRRIWTENELKELGEALRDVLSITSLRSVRLSVGGVTDQIAEIIAANRNLVLADIRGPGSNLSDNTLRLFAELPNLRELILEVGPEVGADGVRAIETARKLERIRAIERRNW